MSSINEIYLASEKRHESSSAGVAVHLEQDSILYELIVSLHEGLSGEKEICFYEFSSSFNSKILTKRKTHHFVVSTSAAIWSISSSLRIANVSPYAVSISRIRMLKTLVSWFTAVILIQLGHKPTCPSQRVYQLQNVGNAIGGANMVDLNIINLRHCTNDHRIISIDRAQARSEYHKSHVYQDFLHPEDRSTVPQSA